MNDLSPLISGAPGALIIALVAFAAGLIRGFTGFGGPAFMLAILTIFFTPISIISKVLVVDFAASTYLFITHFKQINWRATLTMAIPSLLFIPLGHWLLLTLDADWMKRAIAVIIVLACVLMLLGYRYKKPMTTTGLLAVGASAGVIFGGTYIALVAVIPILLGPYDKNAGRTLIISWAFFTALGFALISSASGTTAMSDITTALPGAVAYLLGTWLGALGFRQSSEKLFRRAAIGTLLVLSLFNLVS